MCQNVVLQWGNMITQSAGSFVLLSCCFYLFSEFDDLCVSLYYNVGFLTNYMSAFKDGQAIKKVTQSQSSSNNRSSRNLRNSACGGVILYNDFPAKSLLLNTFTFNIF